MAAARASSRRRRGMSPIRTAAAAGIHTMSERRGKSLTAFAPSAPAVLHEEDGEHRHRADENGQRVDPHVARLEPACEAGATPDTRAHTVDGAVDDASVEHVREPCRTRL